MIGPPEPRGLAIYARAPIVVIGLCDDSHHGLRCLYLKSDLMRRELLDGHLRGRRIGYGDKPPCFRGQKDRVAGVKTRGVDWRHPSKKDVVGPVMSDGVRLGR